LGPTMPFPAFNIGEKIDDPLALYLSDINTVPANIIGIPAISVPCGFADGLPVGLQIMAGVGEGGKIIRVAFTYEKNTNWHKKAPQIDF
jgi:aspartyl-tRNA(Asn)/glutamyl-tRNA(Gln) amidotransferase subunit A